MKLIPILLMLLLYINHSEAISINPNGTGEVIIVPYFTVNNGLNTYITVSNTTDADKAVNVVFSDGVFNYPVMNFNLYLSPWETFSFALAPLLADSNIPHTDGAIFFSEDSCVTPISSGQRFRRVPPLSGASLNTTEGTVKIFEMGEIVDGPTSCDDLLTLWDDETWLNDPSLFISPPTGGLKSSASIIDVANGTQFSYEPTAFVDFYPSNDGENYHSIPFIPRPSFIDANHISNGFEYQDGAHALSAVIMKSNVINQFNIESGIAAETEWVLTFPTNLSLGRDTRCFKSLYAYIYDRKGDGYQIYDGPITDGGDPPPPNTELDFCSVINVMNFGDSNERSILDSAYQTEFNSNLLISNTGFIHGQLNLDFASDDDPERFYIEAQAVDGQQDSIKIYGAPVLGFAVQKYYNGNAQAGLLAAYAASYQHTFKEKIVESLD